MDIGFDGHTIRTPVYVKMNARDTLLLSEDVCHQLGIIKYHPLVREDKEKSKGQLKWPVVPMVYVKLVQSVWVLPQQTVMAPVITEGGGDCVLVELMKDFPGAGQVDLSSSLITVCRKHSSGSCTPLVARNVITHCAAFPQCAIVNSSGRVNRPPLCPIHVSRPFKIVGDIMELPKTESGNKYVVVFQDFLTKFPLVFATPDQKAIRLVRLLAQELVPLFGVPEALLSDRGTNLLSHLMKDLCEMLGIRERSELLFQNHKVVASKRRHYLEACGRALEQFLQLKTSSEDSLSSYSACCLTNWPVAQYNGITKQNAAFWYNIEHDNRG